MLPGWMTGENADNAATIVVLACSRMGLPVSTTHTLVGAILGVGLASVDRSVTRDIFGGWLITVPIAAIMSAVLYMIAIAVLGWTGCVDRGVETRIDPDRLSLRHARSSHRYARADTPGPQLPGEGR